MRCALVRCAGDAVAIVAHPRRPEGATALCERHAQIVEEELGAEPRRVVR